MAKVVLYILSLVSDVSQPFLIVSNPSSLSLWEAEFSRLAPSANVVVYNGDKDNRTIIRAFEFCVEVGCVMCQVLLSSIEAVLEDLEMMECLRWEAVIIDECQQAVISEKFEEIKKLSTEVRILLYNNQLKENIDEHLNLLSLLDHCTDLDTNKGSNGDLDGAFGKLRERLSQFIAYESQSVSSRYLEYWVPVMISNVQLEQYCATLLANSTSLLSYSKSETIGALREILISTRKCCDHPYIVDQSLQGLLTEGLPGIEYLLDVGIKASGKLHLLDTILSEIKNQGLRVVILFQSIGGSGRDSIGDILDDFIRQRFGPDSYERVDGGVLASKKQAALNKFNDKGTGIFVFLLENRACGHSIRISSVDAIILFDSDWNPAHDLKALKRISADSSMKQIKIFRLYSACTVEESVLNLATQEVTLDSNFLSISRGTIHMLLMWGASYLFSKLDKFHCGNTSTTAGEESSDFPLQEVAKEFMALLYRDDQNAYLGNSQIIRVQHVGGKYIKDVPLFGELKIQSTGGEEPMLFWRKLLGGRNPRWKYSSGPLKRNRKRVRNFHESPKKPLDGTDEVVKKRKRLVNNTTGSASPRAKEKGNEFPVDNGGVPAGNSSQHMLTSTAVVNGTRHIVNTSSPCIPSNGITPVSDIQNNGPEEGILLHKGQKDLHDLLKSEISKLSEILRLSEDVKVMVGRFLEYIFDNHHVNREPLTILQAFQISLCWIASSLLKCKIDKKESLALAKQHLNFGCSVEEATNVYSKLHLLKKSFLSHVDNFKESESSKDSTSAAEDIMKELPDGGMFQPMAQSLQNVKVELEDRSENQASAEGFSQQEVAKHKVMEKLLLRSLERTQKKNEERIKELIRKQQDQIQEFNKIWEGKREALEEKYRAELTIVRTIYRNSPLQLSKIKTVEDGFAKQMEELNILKGRDLKELQKSQLNERIQEREKAADRLEEIKSRQKAADRLEEIKSQQQAKLSGDLPLYGTEPGHTTVFRVHNSPDNVATMSRCLASEHTQSVEVAPSEMHTAAARPAVNSGVRLKTPSLPQCRNDGTGAATSKSGCLVEEQGPIVTQAIELAPCQMQAAASSQAVDCSVSLKTPSLPPYSNREKDAPASKASEKALVAGFEQHNLRSCIDAPEDNVLVSLTSSQEEIQDGTSCREKDMPESAPYKLVVGVDFPGIADSNIDSNMEHNSVLDPMAINNNTAGSSISSGTVSSMVNSPVVEPGVTAAPDGLLSQNLVPQDECGADSSTCIRVHDADAAICGEESVLRQAEVTLLHSDDAGATNQTNQELVNGHGYQLQLPVITDLHVDQNHPDPCAAPGADLVVSEAETPCQGLEAPNLVNFQCAANIMSSPPHAIDEPIRQEHPEFHLADRNDNQPRSEGSISFQNADNSFQIFVTSGLPSQNSSGTQLGASRAVDTPLGGSGTPIMVHSAPYMASRMPNQLYIDPLQNELERLHKDIDQAIKCHEETKLQLKSDCDREIEETIAAIRRKYEAKLQEAENAFLQKKNALDTNQNKVYMNKILAETFQFKCLDLRQSGASRVCQVAPSNMMLQPHVLSPSQVAPSLSPVTGLTGAPPIQVVQNSSELISTMPTRSQPVPSLPPISGLASVSSTAANQLTGAPPVQIVQNSPVLMSNMPTRPPPLIASITRPTGNSQVIGEIRAPAPHLQPFGPPSTPPMTIPPLPRVLPSQQAQRNSPTVPQVLPRGPPPPPPPPPMYQSSQNALSSALGLTDNSNQGGANPPNILPPLQDLGINFGPLDLSQFGTPQTEGGSGRSNMACSAAETDVVCLSDDD
ncbi:DNA helicase [Bertholletia excelsa]